MDEARMERIKELRQDLARLEEEAIAEERARQASVEPKLRVLVHLSTSFHPLYDPECAWYTVRGVIDNPGELLEAGWSERRVQELAGGMDYLYNGATRRIVHCSGGGRVYLGFDSDTVNRGARAEALQAIADRIDADPEGVIDVTDVVAEYERAAGK